MTNAIAETDSAEFSGLIYNSERAAEFRQETKQYLRQCLSTGMSKEPPVASSFDPVIANFITVGTAIFHSSTPGKFLSLIASQLTIC